MRCRLCDRWRARQWEKSDAWECAHSNESELWWEEPARNRELIQQAYDSHRTDPAAAFALYLEAAEAGSAWGMETVGLLYWAGEGVAPDSYKAQEYLWRAIDAGSWTATISYSRLLADLGDHEQCDRVLEDGVAKDFVPACFWLAWFRYRRCPNRATLGELRPMLGYAAEKGHPMARIVLAHLMMRGKFGLREIPAGVRLACRWLRENEQEAVAAADAPAHE